MKTLFPRAIDYLPRLFATLEGREPSVWRHAVRSAAYCLLNIGIGHSIPFARRSSFRVLAVRPGYLKAGISIQGNKNHIGTMYAGAMFVLAEIPGGIIALFDFGSGYVPILKKMTISYRLLAKTDLTVEVGMSRDDIEAIRRKADEEGKCDFSLSADLVDTSGSVVAQSTGHYQLRRRASD